MVVSPSGVIDESGMAILNVIISYSVSVMIDNFFYCCRWISVFVSST